MKTAACLVDVADLNLKLQEPGLRVIDCRFDLADPQSGIKEYELAHLPGALYADLNQDLSGPVSDHSGRHPLPRWSDFIRTLESWGIEKGSDIVVYDQASGAFASRLWWMLQYVGHPKVALLNGGFNAWKEAGLPTTSGPLVRPVPARYAEAAAEGIVYSTQQIEEGIADGSLATLIDAREPARFAGEVEPIDPVAGHIPGAMNFPLSRSLKDNGMWLSRDELRWRWSAVLTNGPDAPWIAMCGSGVTACHIAFSAQYAGFSGPGLYAGSWSEWIRDAERPIATGGAAG